MSSVYDTLRDWARRTSGFGDSQGPSSSPHREPASADGLVYRLRQWPELPDSQKTAPIYRLLSVMSQRPVNRQWMLAQSRLAPQQIDALLHGLRRQAAVEVIDTARFGSHDAARVSRTG